MEVFTVGHSNYPMDKLIHMLNLYDINCVVDIRGTPYSKYNVQYNLEELMTTFKKNGYIFIYMAKEFAAQREDRNSYTEEGYADFTKVVLEKNFISGIKRLRNGCEKGYKIVLLGAMQEPIRCHRAILVGRELERHGFDVKHILHDCSLASQNDIEEMLIDKYYKNGYQISLDNINAILSKKSIIDEAYKKANREIGFRVENLK